MAATSRWRGSGTQVPKVTSTTLHGNESGWYQKNEEDKGDLMRKVSTTRCEEKTIGEEEMRQRGMGSDDTSTELGRARRRTQDGELVGLEDSDRASTERCNLTAARLGLQRLQATIPVAREE